MREYLCYFMEYCDYPDEARAALLDAYDRLLTDKDSADFISSMLAAYENDVNCDYDSYIAYCQTLGERHSLSHFTYELLIFILLTKKLKQRYDERGLSEQIYRDSVLDLKWKLLECISVKGVWGTFVARWFIGWFRLTRFALGRLQFELVKFGRDYQRDGVVLDPTTNVLNVHIPRSMQPITPDSVDDSFARAKEFYSRYFTDKPCVIVCSSWMLYPGNSAFLHPLSNTARFAARFDVLSSAEDAKDSNPNVWRVFNAPYEGDPQALPVTSSITASLKEYLIKGGKMGTAYGVLFC